MPKSVYYSVFGMEEAGKLQCEFGIMVRDFLICKSDGTIESMSKFMFNEKYGADVQNMVEAPTADDFVNFYYACV